MRRLAILHVSLQQLPTINARCNSVKYVACDVSAPRATVVKDGEIQENPASNSLVTQAQTYNFPLVYLRAQQLVLI